MTATINITPQDLRKRLTIITTDFRPTLEKAEKEKLMLEYTYQSTPFGNYPIALAISEGQSLTK